MSDSVVPALALLVFSAMSAAQTAPVPFDGLEKWSASLTPATTASLPGLYSTAPPARFIGEDHKPVPDISPETDFWQRLVASGASGFEVNTLEEADQKDLHIVVLAISVKIPTTDGPRTRYVNEQQAWQQQGDRWRIVVATHSDPVKMLPALHRNPNLYNTDADARAEIQEAVTRAKSAHGRVILVFGGNWCYDCHVLDQAFHQVVVARIVERNFQVVHVDIGTDGKKNHDLAAEYKVPLEKGVPALAILGPDGTLLYSQMNGEFESARSMDPDDVLAFLNKWKP
jgi:thioredoxin 1